MNEAVKLQGPYVVPDCVTGESSLESMTLINLGTANQDVATREVLMVAFIKGHHTPLASYTVCSSPVLTLCS